MANRGLLPKFRPATLGGREASLRPVIRPVRPTAPPPPPTPPRRRASSLPPGVDDAGAYGVPSYAEPPTMAAARERLHQLARELPRDHAPQFEEATRARIDGAIARYSPHHASHHLDAASYDPQPASYANEEASYEDDLPIEAETSLRNEAYAGDAPNSYYPPATSDSFASGRYDDEQDDEDDAPYGEHGAHGEVPVPKYSRGGPPGVTDSGPRERPAPASVPYDNEAYETSYPGVDRRGIVRHEPSRDERRESYRNLGERLERDDDSQSRRREEPRDSAPPQERMVAQAQPTRREDSGARQFEMPTEMKVPANFVVGVQAIRQPVAIAPVPSFPQADAMALPAPAGTMAASPRAMQAGQQQPMVAQAAQTAQAQIQNQMQAQMQAQLAAQMQPAVLPAMPAPAMPMMPGQRVPTTRPPFGATPRNPTSPPSPAHPVGHQLQTTAVEEAAQGSKVGRFAWFVFGAAFGIFFAFFATGFVPRLGKKEEIVFPPTAQQTAPTAVQTTAQPVAAQPGVMPASTFVPQAVAATPGQPTYPGAAAVTGQAAFPQATTTMTAPAPAYAAQPTASPITTATQAPQAAQAPQAPAAPQPAFAAAPTTTTQRAQAPRPRFQPVRGPRRATKAESHGDDDAPPAKSSGDSSDLLNAGLGN